MVGPSFSTVTNTNKNHYQQQEPFVLDGHVPFDSEQQQEKQDLQQQLLTQNYQFGTKCRAHRRNKAKRKKKKYVTPCSVVQDIIEWNQIYQRRLQYDQDPIKSLYELCTKTCKNCSNNNTTIASVYSNKYASNGAKQCDNNDGDGDNNDEGDDRSVGDESCSSETSLGSSSKEYNLNDTNSSNRNKKENLELCTSTNNNTRQHNHLDALKTCPDAMEYVTNEIRYLIKKYPYVIHSKFTTTTTSTASNSSSRSSIVQQNVLHMVCSNPCFIKSSFYTNNNINSNASMLGLIQMLVQASEIVLEEEEPIYDQVEAGLLEATERSLQTRQQQSHVQSTCSTISGGGNHHKSTNSSLSAKLLLLDNDLCDSDGNGYYNDHSNGTKWWSWSLNTTLSASEQPQHHHQDSSFARTSTSTTTATTATTTPVNSSTTFLVPNPALIVREKHTGTGQLPLHIICQQIVLWTQGTLLLYELQKEDSNNSNNNTDNDDEATVTKHTIIVWWFLEVLEYITNLYPAAVCTPDGTFPMAILSCDYQQQQNKRNIPLHYICMAVSISVSASASHQQQTPRVSFLEIIIYLIQQWHESCSYQNSNGNLPLHCAVLEIDITPMTKYNNTMNQLEVVQYLVNIYPNGLHVTNQQGYTPYEIALQSVQNQQHGTRHYNHPVLEFLRNPSVATSTSSTTSNSSSAISTTSSRNQNNYSGTKDWIDLNNSNNNYNSKDYNKTTAFEHDEVCLQNVESILEAFTVQPNSSSFDKHNNDAGSVTATGSPTTSNHYSTTNNKSHSPTKSAWNQLMPIVWNNLTTTTSTKSPVPTSSLSLSSASSIPHHSNPTTAIFKTQRDNSITSIWEENHPLSPTRQRTSISYNHHHHHQHNHQRGGNNSHNNITTIPPSPTTSSTAATTAVVPLWTTIQSPTPQHPVKRKVTHPTAAPVLFNNGVLS